MCNVITLSKAAGLCPETVAYENFSSRGKRHETEITAFSDKPSGMVWPPPRTTARCQADVTTKKT